MTNPDISGGNGEVRITLKDLYMAQKQYEGKLVDSDKKLGEALADLRITLIGIQTHLTGVDARNTMADELVREQGRRIGDLERAIDSSGVRSLPNDFRGLDERLTKLETNVATDSAVQDADRQARSARTLAKQTFWGMIVALATAIGIIVTLVIQAKGH